MLPPNEDGLCRFIPAGAIRDPATVVKDEDLTWEEFNEATLRMIAAMKVHGWPTDRIDMHIDFWSALQNHRWRLAPDTLKQRALLLYQAQQRRMWHLHVNTPHGWSLAKINQKVLYRARDELFDEQLVSITLQAPAITGSGLSGASHSRSVSAQKRSASPTEQTGGASKRAHTIFPCCAVCLGRFPHRVIECSRSRTWDNRHKLSRSVSTRHSGPKMANCCCAQHGKEKKAVPEGSNMLGTSTQGVVQSAMERSNALVHRRVNSRAEAWGSGNAPVRHSYLSYHQHTEFS
ncbi:hypothetical protein EDD22DRAFT_917410 [Suillus occidentalis]|nr:hypothetical protein EDD22DRAFT_917410 [Suillus occidentalis]